MRLEKITESDRQLYDLLVFDEQVMNMNLGRVFSQDEADTFFRYMLDLNSEDSAAGYYKAFAEAEGSEVFVGLGGLTVDDGYGACELEYMLLPQYWHRGHGTELVKKLLETSLDAGLPRRFIAITDPDNTYSRRILLRNGFSSAKTFINEDGEPAEMFVREL